MSTYPNHTWLENVRVEYLASINFEIITQMPSNALDLCMFANMNSGMVHGMSSDFQISVCGPQHVSVEWQAFHELVPKSILVLEILHHSTDCEVYSECPMHFFA